jgi:O-antigen/teichoic acid export membrane protein
MANLKIALIKNSFANGWGKISMLLFRLLQVPIFLHALGVEEYGRWLVLSSLPSWLTLANLGFGSVAANEMSMSIAANDTQRAKSIYSTTIALVAVIALVGTALITFFFPYIKWESFLNVPALRHKELTAAACFLSISVLLSFSAEAFGGRFRAARKAHIAVLINSFKPWAELLLTLLALQYGHGFNTIAFAILLSNVLYLLVFQWFSLNSMRSLRFGFASIETKMFRILFRKGVAFQAFPLGNALLFQGNILIVQSVLGPVAVALFGTARTLVRSVNQVFELVNQIIWPEFSLLLGAGDYVKVRKLHRLGVLASIISACLCVVALGLFGQWIYGLWTGKTISLSQPLLLIFLLPIPFNALWYTSSVVHMASNKHEGLAIRYLIATVIAVVACWLLAYSIGIEGAAVSTILVDFILIPYVLRKSLFITKDTWIDFIGGLADEFKMLMRLGIQFFLRKRNKKERSVE